MEEVVLNVEKRTLLGKKSKRLFVEKKIPGVFYLGAENIVVQADEAPVRGLATSRTTHLIKVKFQDGTERRAILNDVQFDPVAGKILHFDLHGIKEGQKITVQVPVQLVGTPKGVKDGGIIQHSIHRIKIQCDPENVPEHVEINIDELGIADSIHIKDLKLDGVKILDNPESAIVTVVPPPTIKEETPETAAVATEEPTEPEVIGKTKKAEEGEEEPEETEKAKEKEKPKDKEKEKEKK
ncbi:MAG TPA: 50S ribosomal protein L25 [Candidatus Acidoferrales bacterium]|nr:50S ribosomal protein L25 [Candidatus Acidoferrales bacterium]